MHLARYWASLSAAALSFSLIHTLIDWSIGQFGTTSHDLSPSRAALTWVIGALYGWWGWSLVEAAAGRRTHLGSVLVFTVGWAFAGNGLALLACLPPCSAGFPHQDIAHIGSLASGAVGG